jgi:hypothetical protein
MSRIYAHLTFFNHTVFMFNIPQIVQFVHRLHTNVERHSIACVVFEDGAARVNLS